MRSAFFLTNKSIEAVFSFLQDGMRLDAALGVVFPDLGLRARRRLWGSSNILINGRAQTPAYRVREGDYLVVTPCTVRESGSAQLPKATGGEVYVTLNHQTEAIYSAESPAFIAMVSGYAVFYKPAAMHTVHLAGGDGDSLEAWLQKEWQNLSYTDVLEGGDEILPKTLPILVTRLDYGTSGMILGVFSKEQEEHFRNIEQRGEVHKAYVALLHGHLCNELAVTNVLNTSNRRIVKVMPQESEDSTRHTRIVPCVSGYLSQDSPSLFVGVSGERVASVKHRLPVTFAVVHIQRGARHQIRAHCAFAGYPLVGDSQYGPEQEAGGGGTTGGWTFSCAEGVESIEGTVPFSVGSSFLLQYVHLALQGNLIMCLPEMLSSVPGLKLCLGAHA